MIGDSEPPHPNPLPPGEREKDGQLGGLEPPPPSTDFPNMPEHLFHQRWEAFALLIVAVGIVATCAYAFFENWIG